MEAAAALGTAKDFHLRVAVQHGVILGDGQRLLRVNGLRHVRQLLLAQALRTRSSLIEHDVKLVLQQ